MRYLYLRFANADEMRTQLIDLGFVDNYEQGCLYHPAISLDAVGVITVTTEIENPGEENEIIKYEALPGYHVNLRVMNDELDLSPLEKFSVNPKTPVRVWA